MESKVCNMCRLDIPFSGFHKRTISPDGLDNYCKVCRKVRYKEPLGLSDSPKKFRVPAIELLENAGYIVDGPESVYVQFKRRMEEKGVDVSDWD